MAFFTSSIDYSIFKAINGLSGSSGPDAIFRFVANDFEYVLIALVALAFLAPGHWHRESRRPGAVLATAAAGVALILNQPLSHAVDRLRPFVAHPGIAHVLVARSHDPSFPSDHATGGFALACGMFLYDRTIGTVLFALAAVLAFARVYVGVHYPGDVLAGAAIGILWALLLWIPLLRRQLERVASLLAGLWDGLLDRRPGHRAIGT